MVMLLIIPEHGAYACTLQRNFGNVTLILEHGAHAYSQQLW